MSTQDEDRIAKAKAKIAAMMNMTVENGCTEDEQETAMSMAAGIAAKLGIDLDSIRPKDAPKRKLRRKQNSMSLKLHQWMAGQAACTVIGCEWYSSQYGKFGFEILGREELVEMAEQTMFWLMRQVELLYKQNLPKGMTQRDRAEYRRTFKEACAKRVLDRAEALVRDMRRNDAAAQRATGSNALVVAHHFDQLAAEHRDYWDELFGEGKYASPAKLAARAKAAEEQRALEVKYDSGELKRPKEKKYKMPRARVIRSGNGSAAGRAAGDIVQLQKEIR